MRGERVIVRSFGDRPLVRRVWAADEHSVYISAEGEYQKLSRGEEALLPVGFPREDVFRFDPAIAAEVERDEDRMTDWGRLIQWKGHAPAGHQEEAPDA